MFLEVSRLAVARHNAEITKTDPDGILHPAKDFLQKSGIDASSFPTFRFVVEISRPLQTTRPVHLALRFPRAHGVFFDSRFRLVRSIELIDDTKKFFAEIEWTIDEAGQNDHENHLAAHFIAGEVLCPHCRQSFEPEATYASPTQIQITCSECLARWSIEIQHEASGHIPKLLLDDFLKNPSVVRQMLMSDQVDRKYFPFELENRGLGDRLQAVLETPHILRVSESPIDLDTFARGIMNWITRSYLEVSRSDLKFEKTAIQTKPIVQIEPTEIRQKTKTPQKTYYVAAMSAFAASLLAVGVAWWMTSSSSIESKAIEETPKVVTQAKATPQPATPQVAQAEPTDAAMDLKKIEMREQIESSMNSLRDEKPRATPSAKKVAAKAVSQNDEAIDEKFRQGMFMLRMKHPDNAIQRFKEILAERPDHANSLRALGLAYIHGQDYASALQTFDAYLKKFASVEDKTQIEGLMQQIRERMVAVETP